MATHTPVTPLTDAEAWAALGSMDVGRLATILGGVPDIVPVNFVIDGRSLVFRTAEGGKLLALTVNQQVAFEVDSWDDAGGWSVVAKGSAAEVTDAADLAAAEALPLRPWVPTIKLHYVRVEITEISGRRFVFGPEPEPAYY